MTDFSTVFRNTRFQNREQAAHALAAQLGAYRGLKPLILAIPRGAAPMGRVIADALDGDLDVVLVRKLGAPHNEEFAVGAVDEFGETWIAPFAAQAGASVDYIEREIARQRATIVRRRKQYSALHPAIAIAGRVAIVVDDGLATGATMIAALNAVRAQHPTELVCAVPVAATDSAERVLRIADRFVALLVTENFQSVGQFYESFPQVSDEEVAAVLSQASAHT